MPGTRKLVSDVFGITPEILPDSYVDRGALDERVGRLLHRGHTALRGASKCGKSWLRQNILQEPIIVQCRLGKGVDDIYRDALSELGIRLTVREHEGSTMNARVDSEIEAGRGLLLRAMARFGVDVGQESGRESEPVGRDITDLRFIAEILKESGRQLVVEDFHYMSVPERKRLAFDLKALWDYSVFVLIVGVWTKSNMLIYLNPDLSGRVEEVSITWGEQDLGRILDQGGDALSIEFSKEIKGRMVRDCFENAGILQRLARETLEAAGIYEEQHQRMTVDDESALDTAAMEYAEQLNPLYQQFAERVSTGIRRRKNSTGIYAHTMAVILSADDDTLLRGIGLDEIFAAAHERQPRIQKGNLRSILEKLEDLQVDEDGRGLVLAYNESTREVSVVDRQVLLYRRYSTVKWPWEDLIQDSGESLEADNEIA